MKHLGIKEIQKIIPHRHPFLLVDYIEDYEPGEYAVGYKCVTYRAVSYTHLTLPTNSIV